MSQTNAPQTGGSAPRDGTPPVVGWTTRLYDGTPVLIRPIGKQDAELELEFLDRLSPEMRELRFLGLVHEASPEVAEELTDLDPAAAAGFIAVVAEDGRERQIGAAHFHLDAEKDACDCSATVSDEWQKRGVGSALMHVLIAAARDPEHARLRPGTFRRRSAARGAPGIPAHPGSAGSGRGGLSPQV